MKQFFCTATVPTSPPIPSPRLRLPYQGPRDGDALLLAATQLYAALPDAGVVALGPVWGRSLIPEPRVMVFYGISWYFTGFLVILDLWDLWKFRHFDGISMGFFMGFLLWLFHEIHRISSWWPQFLSELVLCCHPDWGTPNCLSRFNPIEVWLFRPHICWPTSNVGRIDLSLYKANTARFTSETSDGFWCAHSVWSSHGARVSEHHL